MGQLYKNISAQTKREVSGIEFCLLLQLLNSIIISLSIF